MDTVGNNLHGHVVHQVNALHSTLVLVLALVVETRHGVVEVGNVSEAGLESSLHVLVLCCGVCDRRQDALLGTVLTELESTGHFGSGVPTCQTTAVLYDGDVLVGIRILDALGHLRTGLVGVQVVTLEVQTQDGAVGLCHQLVASGNGLLDHGDSAGTERGIDTGCTILGMSGTGHAECLFLTFLEIAAATTVNVHFNTTGNNVHALGINDFGTDNCEVAVGNLKNLVISQNDAAVLQPTLRGEDACVDNLC